MTDESGVFKFHGLSVDGNHLMRFQNEHAVFKFLLRSVDDAYLQSRLEMCRLDTKRIQF